MDRGILVLNSGSSSLKFALYREKEETLALPSSGEIEAMMTTPRFAAHDDKGEALAKYAWSAPIDAETGFRFVLDFVDKTFADVKLVGAGHRLVQGGDRYHGPALGDRRGADLSRRPVQAGAATSAARSRGNPRDQAHPSGLAQVAVFDTSFHRSMPEIAQLYAVPKSVRDEGVRHWGYHGTSYDYINRTLPKHDPRRAG